MDRRPLKDARLNLLRFGFDFDVPSVNDLRLSDCFVELTDALDALLRHLEGRLAQLEHRDGVLANERWDSHERAQFRRQVDILSLLPDFEQRLVYLRYLRLVRVQEILAHGYLLLGVANLLHELVVARLHVPADLMHFVSAVGPVPCHDNRVGPLMRHLVIVLHPIESVIYNI